MMWLDALNSMKKISGKTTEQISADSKIPKGTLNKIFAGQTKDPQYQTLKTLVNCLGFAVDDLDCNEIIKKSPTPAVAETGDERLNDIIDIYNDMNEEGRDKLETYANDLIGNPRHKKENQFELGA